MLPGWPQEHVHVIRQAICTEALDSLRKDALAISHSPNYWVPRAVLEAGETACRTPAELAISQLYHAHLKHALPPSWQGAEYWVQVYQPGKGLDFHFDKDESLLVATGQMVQPLLSSVLYLTGDCQQEGLRREGPTVVLEQVFDHSSHAGAPEDPARCVLVWPHAGSYCCFDGRLGHGVLDSFSEAQRMTMLVNWWEQQPQAVDVLSDEDIESRGMTRLRSAVAEQQQQEQEQGVMPSSNVAAAAAAAQEELADGLKQKLQVQDGASPVPAQLQQHHQEQPPGPCILTCRDPKASAPANTPADPAATTLEGCCLKGLVSPGISIPVMVYDADTGPMLVDQLLRLNGCEFEGPKAVQAISLAYERALLYPLEMEQYRALLGQQHCKGRAPKTAAALVPASMMAEGESDDEADATDDS